VATARTRQPVAADVDLQEDHTDCRCLGLRGSSSGERLRLARAAWLLSQAAHALLPLLPRKHWFCRHNASFATHFRRRYFQPAVASFTLFSAALHPRGAYARPNIQPLISPPPMPSLLCVARIQQAPLSLPCKPSRLHLSAPVATSSSRRVFLLVRRGHHLARRGCYVK